MGPVDSLAGRDVLVTGGAGFIGSHLVETLHPVANVAVLDDLSAGDPAVLPADVSLLDGDVRDADAVADAVAGTDVVFHLAAVVRVEESVAAPRRTEAVNVGGTLAVLDAARDADARAIVTSSAAVYGRPASVPVAETDPTAPRSPYGLSKYAAGRYAGLYHDLYGLETVVLRPFNVYGPRQGDSDYSAVIDVFADQATAGKPITVHGDGTQTRDFVHVSDVVDAYLRAATADVAGETFNVGTGESVTILELAETIRAIAGSESEIVHTAPREGDVPRSRADIARARERLGYRPAVDLDDGLRSLLDGRDA